MSYAVKITGSNFSLGPPPGRDDVQPVHLFKNNGVLVMRWGLTPEELDEVVRTGCVYLSILGHGMPPVFLGSESSMRDFSSGYGLPLPKQEPIE